MYEGDEDAVSVCVWVFQSSREEHPHSLGSNQLEADVIVHSELSDPEEELQEFKSDTNLSLGSPVSHFPCREDALPPSLSTASPQTPNHFQDVLDNHTRPLENGLPQLTLGGVTEEGVSPEHLQPTLENGDHRLHPSKKALSQIGLSTSPPAFARSGLVHSTSGAHSYLCS